MSIHQYALQSGCGTNGCCSNYYFTVSSLHTTQRILHSQNGESESGKGQRVVYIWDSFIQKMCTTNKARLSSVEEGEYEPA